MHSLKMSYQIAIKSTTIQSTTVQSTVTYITAFQNMFYLRNLSQDSYSAANLGKQPDYTTWRIRPLGEEKFVNDFTFYNANNLRSVSLCDSK